MSAIPRSALILGLAGVLPFAWGALTEIFPALFDWGQSALGSRFVGQYVLVFYGTIILSFMSGVLWGFATRAQGGTATLGYGLSTLPALWAFFFVGGGAERATWFLIAGYLGLLGLDHLYARWGLTPDWWTSLRNLLTALVLACLTLGLLF
ncbi:DUF3429 domain-containing protein [Fluviibacterium sp. DFM31]|uniref:DUF3429 domain-containing protein n=1 Tax=Meridianimarinicoccus marinus TaxID=3231483 RepID=A0ABV3L117_9RHOB